MLSDRVWMGKWIHAASCPTEAAPLFRKTFSLQGVKPSQVYVSGVGFYVLYINGKRVGDQLLAPAFTAYDKTVLYNVYDVTELLKAGENKIEITLGNGWFREFLPTAWAFEHATWKNAPRFILDLVMDGETVLCSDTSWQAFVSKTVFTTLRNGETYDASAEEKPCGNARCGHSPGGYLKEQFVPHIRLRETLTPRAVWDVPGGQVYDFGINLTGNAEICVQGEKGEKVTLLFTERLREDKTADPANNNMYAYGHRFQQDEYIMSGEGEERWHSEFCYHGFRYVQVTGNAKVLSLTGRCFHTDLKCAGGIQTDFAPVQALHDACVRSTLTNFHHIPTDCPHREKNGWTGDAHASSEQALFNLDMKLGYQKFLDDLVNTQRPSGEISCIAPTSSWGYDFGNGPTWDCALFEIPWQVYRYTGDMSLFKRYEEPMERYLAMLDGMSDDDIYRDGLGDWCAPDREPLCSTEALLTVYAWYMHHLYSKISALLGRDERAQHHAMRAGQIKQAFLNAFANQENNNQTFHAMMLFFHLTEDPAASLARLIQELEKRDMHIWCGFFGAKYLLNVLTDNGRFDLAWQVAMREGYPGYLDMLSRSAGTLCEDWDGRYSWNHHMFSEIGAWFYKGLAGIQLDENNPGFKHVTIIPHIPSEIKHFCAWHMTPMGKIQVEWDEENLRITLPQGCTATVKGHDLCQIITQDTAFARSTFAY